MINSILSKNSFKTETVLAYALVNAFTKMKEMLSFSMEFNGTSVTSKKVLKRVQTYSQLEH